MRKLEDGFSPVPENVHRRVEATLMQLHQQHAPERSRRGMRLIIVAAVIVVLLASVAVATNYHRLLDRILLPGNPEGANSLEGMIVPVGARWSGHGVSISIEEALCDGRLLDSTIVASADRPILCVIDRMTMGGQTVRDRRVGSDLASGWIGDPMTPDGRPHDYTLTAQIDQPMTGQTPVTVIISLLEPLGALVEVPVWNGADWAFASQEEENAFVDAIALAGNTPVYDEMYDHGILSMSEAAAARRAQERGLPPCERNAQPDDFAWSAFWTYYGNMRTLETFTLTFSMPVTSPAVPYEAVAGEPVRVAVETACISELATSLRLRLYPGEDDAAWQEAVSVWENCIGVYEGNLFDGEGELVQHIFRETNHLDGMECRLIPDADPPYIQLDSTFSGTSVPPEVLRIVPRTMLVLEDGTVTEEYAWEQALTLRRVYGE